MTEDEAKTKWCPFVGGSVSVGQHATVKVTGRGEYGAASDIRRPICIASSCMAWRWVSGSFEKVGDEWRQRGHCGLAGPVL